MGTLGPGDIFAAFTRSIQTPAIFSTIFAVTFAEWPGRNGSARQMLQRSPVRSSLVTSV